MLLCFSINGNPQDIMYHRMSYSRWLSSCGLDGSCSLPCITACVHPWLHWALLSPLRTTQSWRWPHLTVSRGQEKGTETALSQHRGSRLNFTALQDPANMFALYFWFFLKTCRFVYWLLLLTSWPCPAGLVSCAVKYPDRLVFWSIQRIQMEVTQLQHAEAMMSWESRLPPQSYPPPETRVEFISRILSCIDYITTVFP